MVQPPVPSDNHAKRLSGEAEPSAQDGPLYADFLQPIRADLEYIEAALSFYWGGPASADVRGAWERVLQNYRDCRADYAQAHNSAVNRLELLLTIGRYARSDGDRTFDDCIRDLGRIDDLCRTPYPNAPPSDGGMGPATHEGPSGNGLNQNPPTGDQP